MQLPNALAHPIHQASGFQPGRAGFLGQSALNSVCKPISGKFRVQNIEHGPVYRADFALHIKLDHTERSVASTPARTTFFGAQVTDDFLENLRAKEEIKDPKGSIRRKYQTRLRHLAETLDDFIEHAEQRLDAAKAGKIHKRAETEKLLENCRALRAALPVKCLADTEIPLDVYRNLCDIFGLDPDIPDESPK